jgi:hypothetical protein
MQDEEYNDPMMFGCMLFAGPFFILVGWIVLAVIFNWR